MFKRQKHNCGKLASCEEGEKFSFALPLCALKMCFKIKSSLATFEGNERKDTIGKRVSNGENEPSRQKKKKMTLLQISMHKLRDKTFLILFTI